MITLKNYRTENIDKKILSKELLEAMNTADEILLDDEMFGMMDEVPELKTRINEFLSKLNKELAIGKKQNLAPKKKNVSKKAASKKNRVNKKEELKKKVQKKLPITVNVDLVSHLGDEYRIIRRAYNAFHKKFISARSLELLYKAFQKSANTRKIRKSSANASLFNKTNKLITTAYKEFSRKGKDDVSFKISDKRYISKLESFVESTKVDPAVSLVNRYINMQGTAPENSKVDRLLKTIDNAFKKERIKASNRLAEQLKTIQKELKEYLKKQDQVIEIIPTALSIPGVCENRIKCEGLSSDGKLKRGYKFVKGGKVVKVKKKTISKASLGLPTNIEVIVPSNPVIKTECTVERHPGAGTEETETVIKSPENVSNSPISEINSPKSEINHSNPIQTINPSVKKIPGVISGAELMNMHFDTLPFDGEWANFMQEPAANMRLGIYGAPKNGKTSGSCTLANYLTRFGNVLYNFADQGFNKSAKDIWTLSGLGSNPRASASEVQSLDDLHAICKSGEFRFVFIDMINNYIDRIGIKFHEFKDQFFNKYPNISFILVFEVTKSGNFKGDQGWMHIVDAIVSLEDYVMKAKGRYGHGYKVVWKDGLKRENPKKYHELFANEAEIPNQIAI